MGMAPDPIWTELHLLMRRRMRMTLLRVQDTSCGMAETSPLPHFPHIQLMEAPGAIFMKGYESVMSLLKTSRQPLSMPVNRKRLLGRLKPIHYGHFITFS